MKNSMQETQIPNSHWFTAQQRESALNDSGLTFGIPSESLDHERFLEQLQLFAEIKGWHNYNELQSAGASSPLVRAEWASFLFASPQTSADGTLLAAASQLGNALGQLIQKEVSSQRGRTSSKGGPIKIWIVQHSTQPTILVVLAALKHIHERGLLPDVSAVRIRLSQLDGLVEPWRIQTCSSTAQFVEHVVEPIHLLGPEASRLLAELSTWEPLSQLFEHILCSQLTETSVSPFANGHLCVVSHADGVLKTKVLQHVNWLATHALTAGGVFWLNQSLDPAQAHELQLAPSPSAAPGKGPSHLFFRTLRNEADGSRTGLDYINHAMSVLSERVRRSSVGPAVTEPAPSRTTSTDSTGEQETVQTSSREPGLEASVDLILQTARGPAVVFHQDGAVLGCSGEWPPTASDNFASAPNRSEKTLEALLPASLLTRLQRKVLELSLQRTAGDHGADEDVLEARAPTQFGESSSRFRLKRLLCQTPERLHLLEWLRDKPPKSALSARQKADTVFSQDTSAQYPLAPDLFRRIQSNFDNQSQQRGMLAKQIQFLKKSLQKSLAELGSVRAQLEEQITAADDLGADLHQLMEACTCPVLVLDERLRIENFSRPLSEQFGLRQADRERPVTDFSSLHQSVEGALAASLAGLPAGPRLKRNSRHHGSSKAGQSPARAESDSRCGTERMARSKSQTANWTAFRRFSRGQYRGFILVGAPPDRELAAPHSFPLQGLSASQDSSDPLALAPGSTVGGAIRSAAADFLRSAGHPSALEDLCDFVQKIVAKGAPLDGCTKGSSRIQFRIEPGCSDAVSVSESDISTFLVLVSEVSRLAPESVLTCKILPAAPHSGHLIEVVIPRTLPQCPWRERLMKINHTLQRTGLSGFALTEGELAGHLTARVHWSPTSVVAATRPLAIVKPQSAIVLYGDQEQRLSLVSALARQGIVTSCFSLYSSFVAHLQRLESRVDFVFASERVLRTVSAWPENGTKGSSAPASWCKVAHKLVLIADDTKLPLHLTLDADVGATCQATTSDQTPREMTRISYPFQFQELLGSIM